MRLRVIDIGGTKISSAIWSDGVLSEKVCHPTAKDVAGFELTLHDLVSRTPDLQGVAVAATGFTDGHTMRSVNREMIAFWDRYPLRATLQKSTAIPVILINDAQATAWGEYVALKEPSDDLLFITLSTGVGGGLILNGQLRSGKRGFGGHIGHIRSVVEPIDGQQHCSCGQWGCIETVASGVALERQASKIRKQHTNAAAVHALADTGDEAMCALLKNAADAVAALVLQLSVTLDLQHIVIGGGVGLSPLTAKLLSEAVDASPLQLLKVDIKRAQLGHDAGLVGAGYLLAKRLTATST
jgi:N-acylmannosamine kinase